VSEQIAWFEVYVLEINNSSKEKEGKKQKKTL
jgi:hypothetical protein